MLRAQSNTCQLLGENFFHPSERSWFWYQESFLKKSLKMTVLQVISRWETTSSMKIFIWTELLKTLQRMNCTCHTTCAGDNTHVICSQFSFTHNFVTWPDLTFSFVNVSEIWVQDYARAKNKASVYIPILLKLKAVKFKLKPHKLSQEILKSLHVLYFWSLSFTLYIKRKRFSWVRIVRIYLANSPGMNRLSHQA